MKHALVAGVLGALTVSPVLHAQQQAPASSFIAVSPNVNVLRGIDSLEGDKLLQRQNEPVAAVSTRNPSHIMVAANDYRAVEKGNDPGLGDALTRLARQFASAAEKIVARVFGRRDVDEGDEAIEKAEAGTEAWIGLYFSNDGGKSYSSHFMPGSPDDLSPISKSSPIFGRQAASDPVLAAAPAGRFYLGAMAFDRNPITKEISFSQIVVSRFTDRNNSEIGQNFHYDGMTLVDDGKVAARKFLDKPAIAADIHRSSSDPAACGPVYIAFTVFDQQEKDEMERSKILLAASHDCGVSFSPPKKINHRSKLNQGVALAIRPSDGALFAAYRSFSERKMFVVSSTDGGRSFTPAQAISGAAPIRAFDQPTLGKDDNYSFRTNAFPTIAIDGHDNIFVAWQERLVDNGNPRIVITSSADGRVWTARRPVETVRCEAATPAPSCSETKIGPQVMPSLSFSRGRLMLLFFEGRAALDNVKWVASQQASYITGIDAELSVRVAQLDSTGKGSSTSVTHYDTDKDGYVVPLIATGKDGRQYRGVNRPNLPMYAAGTSPFMGDYIALAPTTPFIAASAPQTTAGSSSSNSKSNGREAKDKKAPPTPYWRWATEPTDAPTPAFVAVWGDNRDVVFPRSPITGDPAIDGPWPQYSLGDGPCINPGSRNANVYAATMSPRLSAGTPTTFKPLDIQRAFVLFVQNQTADRKFYRLTILDAPPAVNASFVQIGADQDVLDVEVFPLSTATQNVFAMSQGPAATQAFAVTVKEITAQGGTIVPGGDSATVLFNSDRSNPQLAVTDLTSERHSPRIFNPDNPTKTTPRITNPQVSNPQVSNPQVSNPQVSNPQVSNPQVSNLQLTNSPLADPATPVYSNVNNYTWQVANVGDTASAFAPVFNIANEAVRRNNTFTLYIYKTYRTPTFVMMPGGCKVVELPHDEMISVIDNPQVSNPQVSNPQVSNPQVSNPQVSNPQVSNSTFFVSPSDASAVTGTTAARRLGALTLAAFQSPAKSSDDITTLAAPDAPTYITLSIRGGDPNRIEDPPPPPDDHSPPPAVHPPLTEDDFTNGGSAVAVTATSNDVIEGVIQAVPEAATTGSDLVISVPPTISVSPDAHVPSGIAVTFSSFTIQNVGQQATGGAFQYGFYLSSSSQIDPRLATRLGFAVFAPSIDAGATAVLSGGTFIISPGTLPGEYFIGVRINSGDPQATPPDPKVFEPEFNDSFTIPIHVVPGANLAIVQGLLAPSTLFAGQTTTASVTVANVGTAPAGVSSTAFFRSTDGLLSADDMLLGSVPTPALPPGSSAIVELPLVIPANTAVGQYSVIASGDATGAVPESNEFDNALALSLRVVNTPGTLTFQQQPSPAIAGHAIAPPVQVSVTTQGTVVAGALVQMVLVPVSGTGVLSGTSTAVSDAAGIAIFSNLIVSQPGTYQLTASAPTLGSTPAVLSNQFTVTANHAPTANSDAYQTSQGLALTVPASGVLANDSDADGDPLTAVLVSSPANGQLTLNADGSFAYTPAASFFGTDSFSYAASDSIAQSASTTVTISVRSNLDVVSTRLREGVVFEGQPPIAIVGGNGSRSVTLVSGSLPPGLALTPTGGFTGAPTTHGTFEFTVSITDCTPSTTCATGIVQQTITRTLSLRVSAMEQQSFGLIGATSFSFGGSTGRRLAQVLTVGAHGLLTAVRLNQLACPAGTTIRVGIERVTNGVPNGTEIAFGTGPGTFDPVRLDTPLPIAIGQQLAFVVSTQSVCQMRNLQTSDSYNGGDAFILTSTTARLKDVEGFYDFPFRTFIQPATNVAYLNRGRFGGTTATLLNDGKVLIAGSDNSAELYDPTTNTSALTGNMTVQRFNHTATLLDDGTVLIVGGRDAAGDSLASAEIYDPGTGQFSALSASLAEARQQHTATRLADGRVLIAGGLIQTGTVSTAVGTAEIFDPGSKTFSPAGTLATGRWQHTATTLRNGKILLAGGFTTTFGPAPTSAELYDPSTGTFAATTGRMVRFRGLHTATLLADGRVLVAGGAAGDIQASAELYDPTTDTFSATGSMARARFIQTATLLPDGSVLVAGGFEQAGVASYVVPLATTERFVPATGTFVSAGSMEVVRQGHTATQLQSGKILLTGGGSQSWMTSNSAELFDVGATPALVTTSLPDGDVGVPYPPVTLGATGGAGPPYQIDIVSGAPPSGINYDAGSFTLAGTPTAAGTFTFGVRVTDAAAQSSVESLKIRVSPLDITSPYLLPNAALNRPYSFQLAASSPSVWALAPSSSILPPGLSISSGGVISGTPTSLGPFTFAVIATDAVGRTALKTLNIFVNNPLTIITTTPNDGVLFEFYGGCLQASAGIGQRTWTVTAGSLPPGVTLQPNGCFSGQVGSLGAFTFTAQVTDQSSPPQASSRSLTISVSLVGDQGAGFDVNQPPLPFGGFKIAERVIAGVSGQLRAVRLGGNSICPTGTIITTEIQGVTPSGAPDGISVASGSAKYPFNYIPLGAGTYFAAEQRFTIVFSADASCSVRPTTFDSSVGEGYVLNAAWQRLRDFDGRYDIPFQTLIEPDARLQFMTTRRGGHTATTLSDGRVLLTGNDQTAEIYDPAADRFTRTGDMSTPRVNHTAVLLADGSVLIAGGRDFSNTYLATAELFHPDTGQFELLASHMSSPRTSHTATRLQDGRVLILGGAAASGPSQEVDSAELYDPATRSFAPAGTMTGSRVQHTATLLPDGRVFIAGGFGFAFASAEFFDPVTMTFTRIAARMPPRAGHTATLLPDGTVLLTGGGGDFGNARNDADLFDPAAGTFTSAGTMRTSRIHHAAALQSDGSVLVAGGLFDNTCCDLHPPQASIERWVRGPGFVGAGSMAASRNQHQMTPLSNGTILMTGGFTFSFAGGRSAEKFDAATMPAIANPRLPDGHSGTAYVPVTLFGTGGTAPYTITLVSGTLPSGIVYDAATSTLSGTPTQSGTFELAFRVSDAAGHSTTETLTLRVDSLTITSSTLPVAFTAVPYNAPVGVTGVAPVTLSVTAGSLPPGLSVSGTAITGTPTALGFYGFTLQATDNIGQVAQRNLGIGVQEPLTITTTSLPDGAAFDFYGSCLFSSGGLGARTWSLATGSGALPTGVTLQPYGCFTGEAQTIGTFNITVQAVDSASPPEVASKSFSVTILAHDQEMGAPTTVSAISFGATSGRSLAQTVTVGAHQLLTAVNAWSVSCPPGTPLSVEIQGVTPTDFRPNGTVLATGSGFWYAPIHLSPQVEFGKDERFAIVVSSPGDCTLHSVSPEERYSRGDAFERVDTGTWERRADLRDMPFRTLITAQTNLTYLSATWRFSLTGTLLNNGKVLLVGGGDNTADLYDVATATVERTGSTNVHRIDHTATLLNDGSVLVAGGRDINGRAISTAEVYDPTLGTFTPTTGTLANARIQHTATLLADGRVLIAGGYNEGGGLASIEVYDPATRTFAPAGSMLGSRWIHTATRLNDGRVLFVGGATNGPFPVPNGEVYDPATNSSTPTSEPITFLRARHTATLLSDGRVLIAGGTRFYPQMEPVAEFYDPATNRLISGPTMLFPRADLTATRLVDATGAAFNEVALIGGVQSDAPGTEPISQVEIYSQAAGAFFPAGSLAVDRARQIAVAVGARQVLVAGGFSSGWLASHTAEVWDERFNIAPNVLPDGRTGVDYAQVLEANGGRAPFTVAVITGSVPPGLTVTPISGFGQYRLQIAGTPTASGTYAFSVRATDDLVGSVTQGYTIRIDPATIVTTTLPNAAVGTAYDHTLSATGVGAVTWDVAPSSALPPWLTLTSSGHLMTSNPPSSGFFAISVRATDSLGQTVTRVIVLFVESPLIITTTTLGDAVAPWRYGSCLGWTGGSFPVHFSVTNGALPYGVTLLDYGCFSGNALETGTFQFDVTAKDDAQQNTKTFTLRSGTADQAQFSIDQSTPPSTISFGGATAVAQVFTTAMHGSLIDMEIPVTCSDAGLHLEIRGVADGRPNTTVLGFEDFAAADVSPFQFGPYHRQLRLSAPIFLAKGTQAAAVLQSSGSCSIYLGSPNQNYQFGDAFIGVSDNWTAIGSIDPTRPDIPFHAIMDDGGRLLFETYGRSETAGVPLAAGPNAGSILFAAGSGNTSTLFNATDHSINGLPPRQFGLEAFLVDERRRHTLTALPDGFVLAVGGWHDQQQRAVGRVEMYNPATNSWTTVDTLNTARFNHTATLIGGNRVLIAGGQTQWGTSPLSSTEIFVYDGNGTGHLIIGPPLNDARAEFTALALPNGQAAMIGGWGPFTPGIELYTPDAGIGTFTRDIQLQVPRSLHAAILLACASASPCADGGKALILGGWLSNGFGAALEAEIYDPLTHTSTIVGSMIDERALFAAVQLDDGRVLTAGGMQHSGATLSSTEIYDRSTRTFSAAGEMAVPRGGIAAVHLSDDSALFVGGFGASAASWGSAELFASDRLLQIGRLNTAYASSIPRRGTPPFTFRLKAGELPTGIQLDAATGALSGTPTQTGRFVFVISIVDSSGREVLFDGTIQVDAAAASQAWNVVEADISFVDRSTAVFTVQFVRDGSPAAAPQGGLAFDVTSANTACVSVPTGGTIAAGATSASVTVAPGDTAPLPCTTTVSVSGTNMSGDFVTVTVTPSTAPRPNPTGPGTTMVTYFNPAPVTAAQRQIATFASVSFSNPVAPPPVVTERASTTAVSFFSPAPGPPTTPAVRNSLAALSYFNTAPVSTVVQRQVATVASLSFSNPAAGQTPVVVSRSSTTSVSFFNPAPVGQPTIVAMRTGLTTLSFFNPAPIAPTVTATMRTGLAALSFFNPAPPPTLFTIVPTAASAPAVSFANDAAIGGGAGTIALRAGGTLDALTFAAGPTITEISPARLSVSAPAPMLVITGANLFGVTDVTFSDPAGITIGAINASPDGRTLSIPIVLAPATPTATITVTVTSAMGSSPITDQSVVTIVP